MHEPHQQVKNCQWIQKFARQPLPVCRLVPMPSSLLMRLLLSWRQTKHMSEMVLGDPWFFDPLRIGQCLVPLHTINCLESGIHGACLRVLHHSLLQQRMNVSLASAGLSSMIQLNSTLSGKSPCIAGCDCCDPSTHSGSLAVDAAWLARS